MQYVGLDVHKNSVYATVLDAKGKVILKQEIPNEKIEVINFFSKIRKAKVALEACYAWQWLYDYLETKGYEVTLAHPLKTRLIAEARIKNDSIDSETLAYLLRADLIAKSYVPCKEIRKQRRIARHRASLVKIRTIVKNMIHALLARNGIKHEFSDLFGRAGMEFLKNIDLDEESRFELNQYLMLLRVLNCKIEETQEIVEDLAGQNYYAKLLISIPGISYLSALIIASEIADIRRFNSSKALTSYAGLVPSTYSSGNRNYHGSITKQGSYLLRWVLIQASNKAIESNNYLKKFYLKLERKKGRNVAIVAVARKLLRYIWVMLSYGLTFDVLRINKG
jgi:transposase